MDGLFITITRINDYIGVEMLRTGMELLMKKDTNNPYDDEAIHVYTNRNVKVGFVANSVCSVIRGTHSAGYVYQKIDDKTKCKVFFIGAEQAIAKLI